MGTMQFETRKQFNAWNNENELFEVFNVNGKHIGYMSLKNVKLLLTVPMLTEGIMQFDNQNCRVRFIYDISSKDLDRWANAWCTHVFIAEEKLAMTHEQEEIINELRSVLRKAVDAGIMFATRDDKNGLFAINFDGLEHLQNSDGTPSYWDEESGKFVHYNNSEMGSIVTLDDKWWNKIDEGVDFISWGSSCLPWRAHIKKS